MICTIYINRAKEKPMVFPLGLQRLSHIILNTIRINSLIQSPALVRKNELTSVSSGPGRMVTAYRRQG